MSDAVAGDLCALAACALAGRCSPPGDQVTTVAALHATDLRLPLAAPLRARVEAEKAGLLAALNRTGRGSGGADGARGTIHTVQDGIVLLPHVPSETIIPVCRLDELPPGAHKVVEWEDVDIAVVNCAGEILAIEDRCSHDDGILLEGELDQERCRVECPRHGSVFDLRTGQPLNLPAYLPVETYDVLIEDGHIKLEVE